MKLNVLQRKQLTHFFGKCFTDNEKRDWSDPSIFDEVRGRNRMMMKLAKFVGIKMNDIIRDGLNEKKIRNKKQGHCKNS